MRRNNTKANSRAKKMYQTWCNWPFIKKEDGKWRACTSITEFLSLKWVKTIKETGEKRFISDKIDAKRKNKKERIEAKKQIQEGIKEWDTQYDEYTCPCCEFYDKGFCTNKGVFVEDESICKHFRD